MTGFYIHVPFCIKKCDYCDFYSETGFSVDILNDYYNSLLKNMMYLEKRYPEKIKTVDTIYIGGGTPLVMGKKRLADVIQRIKKLSEVHINEMTIEINPVYSHIDDIKYLIEKKLITRISVGVQSFFENELRWLGRSYHHEIDEILSEIFLLDGVDKNLDFIVGQPGFSIKRFRDRFETLKVDEKVEHISVYMLSLSETLKKRGISDSEELERKSEESMSAICELLKEKGYMHYEISAFCKYQKRCLHNLHYWKLDDYLSIGAESSMKVRDCIQMYGSIKEYIESPFPLKESEHIIDLFDYLMMRCRLVDGFQLSDKRFKNIKNLLQTSDFIYNKYSDYVIFDKDRFSLSEKGFLFYNTIISDFLIKLEE